jgi:aspartate/methionine/tyrosine aminotransferase
MKLDLGYGNPGFLQEEWAQNNFLNSLNTRSLMPYKFAKKNDLKLEKEILELHIANTNVKISDKTRIVVSVGAVQSLQAAMYALKTIKGLNQLYIPKPYWVRFNDFAKLMGLTIVDQAVNSISLVTSPNNPDGKDQSNIPTDIRDACYNWTHYTDNVKEFDDLISIFSLSKLSGHSSTRIGWAVVQDPAVADLMQYYVNIITSGVSIEAQKNAAEIIHYINNNKSFLINAKEILVNRYKDVVNVIETQKIPIKVLSDQGMFLYIKCDASIIASLRIDCPNGTEFKDGNLDHFRLNLGCDELTFNEFISRLKIISF